MTEDTRSNVIGDWEDRSDMLMKYLLIRDAFEAMKDVTDDVVMEEEEEDAASGDEDKQVRASDLRKICLESVELLGRLTGVYVNSKNSKQKKDGDLHTVMYFDMCTYLHRVVDNLMAVEGLFTEEERLAALSDAVLAQAPVLEESCI